MRVRGNVSPDVLNIVPYEPIVGKVEVKLRENIVPYEEADPDNGDIVGTGFEYDEYTFILDDVKGLRKTIEGNMEDWLTTGRTLEIDTRATLYINARNDAVDEYTQQLIEEGLL